MKAYTIDTKFNMNDYLGRNKKEKKKESVIGAIEKIKIEGNKTEKIEKKIEHSNDIKNDIEL